MTGPGKDVPSAHGHCPGMASGTFFSFSTLAAFSFFSFSFFSFSSFSFFFSFSLSFSFSFSPFPLAGKGMSTGGGTTGQERI